MGKKAGDKAKAGGKAGRIPKTIAGVKIPKEVRRTGDALIAKAISPEGKAMLASGLTMAAAAATAAMERQRPRRPDPKADTPAGAGAAPRGVAQPQAMADAVGDAVEAVFDRLFGKKPG